jgi:hypothetical protein
LSVVLTPTSELISTSSRLSKTSSSTLLLPTITLEILLKNESLLFLRPLSRVSFFLFYISLIKLLLNEFFQKTIYNYIKNLPDDDIIISLDGFDVWINGDADEAVSIFKKMGIKILFSKNYLQLY